MSRPALAASRKSYMASAESWAQAQDASQRLSMRLAWTIAIGACVVALAEGLALAALAPLKTVVPYTILVDRHTGYVQALDGVAPEKIAADAALTQSLLAQYVVARETFDIATVASEHRKVALWSADAARGDYIALMPASNPQSPLNVYPRSTRVITVIKSISPLSPGVAMVRFDTMRHDAEGGAERPQSWAAILRYRFSNAPMALSERVDNPLGFQVTAYRRDQETVAPPAAAVP